ncbi:MAG: 4Fe-4S dicluster domain-containing protein, partial [Candidatus Thorarchaeota archaeon]
MIQVDISKCTGCRSCEAACSFYHTAKVSNRLARIKVMHLYETGIDGPVVCTQCKERFCMECPVDAMTLGKFGEVIVAPTICTGCGACVRRCPIGAIDQHNDIIFVCDLCGGRPKCVDACTEGAITFMKSEPHPVSLSKMKDQTDNLNPSERRRHFIEHKGVA